jgi:ABC-type branched-subunit amino acid transport system substrate-binding protein
MRTGSRAWRSLVALGAVAAVAVLVAACGSGDKGSSGSSGGGGGGATASTPAAKDTTPVKQATGSPIKVMTIAAVNWNGPAYPNILATAKLYGQYVNDHGGIAGHRLEVETCDEQGDPNQLATCGRKAIANHDVAVIGSFTLTGDRIVPLLEKAHTAWFGICCAVSPAEANSPITFNFGPGVVATPAYADEAATLGCKKPAIVVLDTPTKTITISGLTAVLKSHGIGVAQTVTIPLQSQDYAPQVAQATSGGVDCIIGSMAENQWASFLPAFQQSGSKAKLIGPQGNLDQKVAKNFAKTVEGSIVVGYYPELGSPAFSDFRAAIAKYKPDASLDYDSLAGLGTWTAYVGFNKIVSAMKGPITNTTFLAAANHTTHLDTGGKVPVLDLAHPWTGAPYGYTRTFNTQVAFAKFDDAAHLVQVQGGFHDEKAAAAIAGNAK